MLNQPHVVLVEPAIPQNTGNIARLTACSSASLHLIEPMKFKITESRVKRAGLDYWPEADVHIHASWDAFLEATQATDSQLWFFTTKGTTDYFEANFAPGDFLVFGSESKGLDSYFHERYANRRLRIPMDNPNVRSLNLASAVAAAFYEAKRQIALPK